MSTPPLPWWHKLPFWYRLSFQITERVDHWLWRPRLMENGKIEIWTTDASYWVDFKCEGGDRIELTSSRIGVVGATDMESTISQIASQTGLSESAVRELRDAIVRGGGKQAQFDHPDLGGMGQWMQGGMIMVGDMFNGSLVKKVSVACALLSESEQVRSAAAAHGAPPAGRWWPEGLGEPSQSAGQNGLDYAYFPASQRLSVRRSGRVVVYDLSGVTVRGVGAQGGQIIVQTDEGPRNVEEFTRAS